MSYINFDLGNVVYGVARHTKITLYAVLAEDSVSILSLSTSPHDDKQPGEVRRVEATPYQLRKLNGGEHTAVLNDYHTFKVWKTPQ